MQSNSGCCRFLWTAILLCTSLPCSALPIGITKGASVEGITEYQLDNGLKVLLFPDPTREQITVNVTYFVGSRHEGYGETGMAHLLEHLVFKGSTNHPDIAQELSDHGVKPNGTTSLDRTNYYETFKATDENLAWALDLEADRMVNSFISAEDLKSEMTVVRNEWEARENNPSAVLYKRLMSTAYSWHNYGNATIGSRSDIENVPIERLQAFYKKYYQPDNAMLVIAGRFDETLALELVSATFGAVPRPDRTGANEIISTYTQEPAQDGMREVTLRRAGDTQVLMGAWHIPSGVHDDFPALEVLSRVLSSVPSGRLYRSVVEAEHAAFVFSHPMRLREPGLMRLTAVVREEDSLSDAQEAVFATLQELSSNPITDQEVREAVRELSKNLENDFLDTEAFARGLSEWAATGDWRLYFIHRDRIADVTAEDVNRVAGRYLQESNLTLARFIPDDSRRRVEVPDTPDVAALVSDYAGREALVAGEAFEPSIDNIEARTQIVEFDSGFRLALLPKKTRGQTVVLDLSLRHGTERSLTGRSAAGKLAVGMLMRGTTELDRQGIKDALDRLQSELTIDGEGDLVGVQLNTRRPHLIEALRLIGGILREPAFDEAEFRTLKEEQLALLESVRLEPTVLAVTAIERHLNPWPVNHPDYVPTTEEAIARLEGVDFGDARAFYKELFGASSGAVAAIVGDFDPDEVIDQMEAIFGQWTPETPYERFDRPFRDIGAMREKIHAPDKAMASLWAGVALNFGDDHPDYAPLVLGNYMIGGGFLSSRLATRLRQEEGLSYAVSSYFTAGALDERAEFGGTAIFAPENAEAVQAAFLEEIRKAAADGFTSDEVDRAKSAYLDKKRVLRADDDSLARMMTNNLFLGRPITHWAQLESDIASVTAERVNQAVARHLDADQMTIVVAGDFE